MAKVSIAFIDLLSSIFELESLARLNTLKKNFEANLSELFNDQEEDNKDYKLLQQFRAAEFIETFPF